ncbi:MAG: gliding motility-associated protein GldE, partial [Spirosoma sp.]|nr:gliding motility-associated protein GldE [Spirosoma sp.]
GKLPLTDVCRVLNIDATTFETMQGDSESLGGLLLELFGRLPKSGDETTYAGFTFHILSADDKRINEVRVVKPAGAHRIKDST